MDGIRANDFVHAVREDPKRPGLLFAGTEHGIYVSFNDGAEWESLALNLPDTQIADLTVEQDDLIIATHGRSFYVLDDIDCLREMTPQVAAAPAYLFEPRAVLRGLNQAVVDYYLAPASGKVSIEILDDSDKLVRRFDSGATAHEDESPATRPGVNRFIWDLRYPGPIIFPGIILRGATAGLGPLAPPGHYRVRLIANGLNQTRTLEVRRDPRIPGITDDDLREQFRLAMDIARKTSDAHEAVLHIRALYKALDERAKSSPEIARSAATIRGKLSEVESDLYQIRNRSPRDTLNYPIKINNQLAVLQQQVDTGNAKPTDQDYAVFDELKQKLAAILARLDQIFSEDLKQFNSDLASRGLPPISVP